jgi:hypothetical protein
MNDQTGDLVLYHGTSASIEDLIDQGLIPGRHGAVFLTDNPQLALEYGETDKERSGSDETLLLAVRVADLDLERLTGDIDHTLLTDWRESLSETDECMYMGAIPWALLTVEMQQTSVVSPSRDRIT